VQLHDAEKDIEAAGARLVFIGQATPKHAAHFRKRFADGSTILADDKRETYKAAGLKRGGPAELIGPGVLLKSVGNLRKGVVQGRPIGDVAQLGGAAIVMPDGSIPWSHVSKDAADNVDPDEIIEHLTEATKS
jgi:hypothetical protein